MRENRTQGTVRGRSGNWPSYLDTFFVKSITYLASSGVTEGAELCAGLETFSARQGLVWF